MPSQCYERHEYRQPFHMIFIYIDNTEEKNYMQLKSVCPGFGCRLCKIHIYINNDIHHTNICLLRNCGHLFILNETEGGHKELKTQTRVRVERKLEKHRNKETTILNTT